MQRRNSGLCNHSRVNKVRSIRHNSRKATRQKQLFKDIKAAIYFGKLVALTGIVGCGKTVTLQRLQEILEKEGKILVV